MELTIKKVLAIDREAEEYRRNMDEVLVTKKKELENFIKTFENEYSLETERIKSELTETKICEAGKITEEIRNNKSTEIDKLNNQYKMHKDILVNEIFKYIICSN